MAIFRNLFEIYCADNRIQQDQNTTFGNLDSHFSNATISH